MRLMDAGTAEKFGLPVQRQRQWAGWRLVWSGRASIDAPRQRHSVTTADAEMAHLLSGNMFGKPCQTHRKGHRRGRAQGGGSSKPRQRRAGCHQAAAAGGKRRWHEMAPWGALCHQMAPRILRQQAIICTKEAPNGAGGERRQVAPPLAIWRRHGAKSRLMAPRPGAIWGQFAPLPFGTTWRHPKPETLAVPRSATCRTAASQIVCHPPPCKHQLP